MNLKILKLLRLCHVLNKSTYKKLRAIEVVRHSSLFDKQWYLENYPDVKEAGQDPARHYCLFGWKEGRNPGPNFNSTRYLDQNPDIKQGNLNPLVHYEKFGKKEGRIPLQSEPKKEFVSAKKKERRDYFFSVIVASYNYQDYIQKTLDSLVAQTYKNFEVIVVDDGSTDESVKVIEKYVQKYPFIRLYQHENGINKGLPETVLLGVQKSKGEYVAFCEGDDYWAKNHLKELNKKINSENDVQIVVNDVQIFGDKKRCEMMGRIISDRKKTILKQCGLLSDDQFCVHNYIVSFSCCCVERMLLTTCDFVGVPNKVKLDWWLWRQICYQNRIYYINKKLTYWRLHLSDNVRNIEGEKCTEFVEKLNKIMDKRKYDSVYSNDQDISGIDKSQISECKTKKKTLIKRIKDGNWQGIKICYVSTTKQISCPIKDGSVRYRCYHPAEALSSKGAFVTVVSHSNFLKAPSYH